MSEQTRAKEQKAQRAATPRAASAGGPAHEQAIGAQEGTIQRALADPSTLSPTDVVYLQRSIGNRAVAQLLGRTAPRRGVEIQPKLQVGPAHDRYEQEADQIAARVQRSLPGGKVQRAPGVQRGGAMGAGGGMLGDDLANTIRRSQNAGQAMPQGVRAALEPKLGADLSSVKVHTDRQAVQLNREVGAKAFTHKNHIYYGAGQRPTDLQLTAHETVHTIQQGAVAQRLGSKQSSVQPKVQTSQNPAQVVQPSEENRAQPHAVTSRSTDRIQRLSVNDKPINFNRATSVTLSVNGADGVYFFHEGTPYQPGSTVAVKPANDEVGDTVATNAMLNKLSGGKTPKTITGNQYKTEVRTILTAPNMDQDWTQAWNKKIASEENSVPKDDKYLGTPAVFKKTKLEHFDAAKNLYVMGLAGGQSFREKVTQGQNATANVLMPADLIKLGRATAIDIFMGNADRLVSGNLGNWMVDAEKTLYLIDNVQGPTLKLLREGGDHTKTWDIYLDQLKSSNIENTASLAARKILVNAEKANDQDIKINKRDGRKDIKKAGWGGMVGTKKVPLKSNPSKLAPIQDKNLKRNHLSVEETYLMTWLMKGMIKGRDDIIRKLAPKHGRRSRSLKNKIVGGGAGAEWDEMKERAKKLKDLG